ncbi:MAG: ABC transporter substrate-binding protein [Pseudomonadota bacterium]
MTHLSRRTLMQSAAALGALAAFPNAARAAESLNIWTIGVAKVGAAPGTGGADWSDMSAQAGVDLVYNAKSGSADQAIQKMIVGDGDRLYDAMTDNGGGMEDALGSQGAIVEIDPGRIANWSLLLPIYGEGQPGAGTIRHDGKLVSVPYISNADSLAFNADVVGEELTTWEALFDEQFRGRAAMQNDFGPTLTNTAIYLKQSGKQDIENPSDMTEAEVKGVAEFLIDLKKKGHFRTFWDGFQNGVDLLASEEVLVSSCWEPIQIVAMNRAEKDIRYGTMAEGHQTWNNVWMLTKGGAARGKEQAFYDLMNVYLSPWFGARTLLTFGFAPQMTGIAEMVENDPDFTAEQKRTVKDRLARKQARYEIAGNSWQNVFPTELRAYQDWWARVQAA